MKLKFIWVVWGWQQNVWAFPYPSLLIIDKLMNLSIYEIMN
jgi:hypothetical protein